LHNIKKKSNFAHKKNDGLLSQADRQVLT